MLIHSTADNSKKIQMRDYPLASFLPEKFSKTNLTTFHCKTMMCTIVQRQLLGKTGLLSAGLQQKAHQLQEHIGNYFSGTQQAFSLVAFPLATSHPLPAPRRAKLKLEFIQLHLFFF